MKYKELYKLLKLNFKNVFEENNKNGEKENVIYIKESDLTKNLTLIRETDTIRIVNALSNNIEELEELEGYKYIKDIVAFSVNVGTYKTIIKDKNSLIKIIITKPRHISKSTLHNIKSKNKINNIKIYSRNIKNVIDRTIVFKRLLSSSGNIRNKKVIYIKQDLWDKANEILLCGLPKDMKHPLFSKFNSYYALVNTDSIPVTTPNFIVVDDYEHEIEEYFDIVEENAKDTYKVNNNQKRKISIMPFDGAGLIYISLAREWQNELELDYVPASFQFRAIPGIKGNLFTFDIKAFGKQEGVTPIVKDAFGNMHDVLKEGINCIMTKSQFKFFKQYKELFEEKKAFDTWKENFDKELYGYKKTFNISHVALKCEDLKDKILLSYQPLQSLDISQNDIEKICKTTVDFINNISKDVDEFIQFRGIDEQSNNNQTPPYYKALAKNKSLFNDNFIQSKVKKDLKRFKENTLKGCIWINGNFQTLVPDVLALAEYTFGLDVTGGLNKHEVYSNYWIKKDKAEIDVSNYSAMLTA